MKFEKFPMAGGFLMLGILVALLAAPVAIGHYTLSKAPAPTQHAEIAAPKVAN